MATQADSNAIEALEPTAVWQFFAQMAAIPRASKREQRICEHVRDLAKKHGFPLREDRVGNLVIQVPASPGHEKAPVTVLQGHLDMVCEKNAGTEHDFDRDPIRLIVDTDSTGGEQIVRADGTTLGADNAIGVAMALAAACSPEVVHGPLELLCTVDEEAGMTGAKALEAEFLVGRRMLNLDSEEDDAIYIGCAGGCDTSLTWNFDRGAPDDGSEMGRVVVSGLRGGHSGGDIHENRGNAIKLLTQTLLGSGADSLRIATMDGGKLRNAIPREAVALVCGPVGTLAAIETAGRHVCAEASRESSEPNIDISIKPVTRDDIPSVLSAKDTSLLLDALAAMPNGVLAMHSKIPDLVQTSTNLGLMTSKATSGQEGSLKVEALLLSRSSMATQLHATVRQISAVGKLASAAVWSGNGYPGWEPDVDSPLLATCRRIYEELFSQSPKVMAIHAGLECGLIGERIGEIDMVSIGPRIEGAHSPDERVWVGSVQKSWKYLTAILADLARG